MNRTIKFRAWHIIDKRMSPISEVDFSRGWFFFTTELGEERKTGQDIVLQQFTGLLDCKGNEIFEGDIIKSKDGVIEIISWGEAQFLSGNLALNSWLFVDGKCKAIEVIGNIYENSELLNDKD